MNNKCMLALFLRFLNWEKVKKVGDMFKASCHTGQNTNKKKYFSINAIAINSDYIYKSQFRCN